MEEAIKRRFSAYPIVEKDSEEDKALQAISLQESNCLWKETYENDNAKAVEAGYYFYLNGYNREHLVCEVIIYPSTLAKCSVEEIRKCVDRIYEAGMKLEAKYTILPEHIRENKNEKYCLRTLSKSIDLWLEDKILKHWKQPIGFRVQ